jgi:hypothetical protein
MPELFDLRLIKSGSIQSDVSDLGSSRALRQTDHFGASIAEIVHFFADPMRTNRRQRPGRRVAHVAIKWYLPLLIIAIRRHSTR